MKKATALIYVVAFEIGKPRYMFEAAKKGGHALLVLKPEAVVSTILARQELSAQTEDLIDAIDLLDLSDERVDFLVEELAGRFDGSLIPRVARFARNPKLRASLLHKLFAQPPKDLYDIYDALLSDGLARHLPEYFGRKLVVLAIERGDAGMLDKAAQHFCGGVVALDQWKSMLAKNMQGQCDDSALKKLFGAAQIAVS